VTQPPVASGAPIQIEWTELTLRVDATITVGRYNGEAQDWMKPGSEIKTHMSGMPNEEQTRAAYGYMMAQLNEQLGNVIAQIQQQLVAKHAG
jgi:hypothetical protein